MQDVQKCCFSISKSGKGPELIVTCVDHQKEKVSILEDVDIELELIHRDEVNVVYILKLLVKLKQAEGKDVDLQKRTIMDLLTGGGFRH